MTDEEVTKPTAKAKPKKPAPKPAAPATVRLLAVTRNLTNPVSGVKYTTNLGVECDAGKLKLACWEKFQVDAGLLKVLDK